MATIKLDEYEVLDALVDYINKTYNANIKGFETYSELYFKFGKKSKKVVVVGTNELDVELFIELPIERPNT